MVTSQLGWEPAASNGRHQILKWSTFTWIAQLRKIVPPLPHRSNQALKWAWERSNSRKSFKTPISNYRQANRTQEPKWDPLQEKKCSPSYSSEPRLQEKNCSPSGKFETGRVRRKRSSVVTRVTVSEFSDQGTKGVSEGLSRREREESV